LNFLGIIVIVGAADGLNLMSYSTDDFELVDVIDDSSLFILNLAAYL